MKSSKIFEFIGATFTILGSFLPWERTGSFSDHIINGFRVEFSDFKYWITGIQKFPVYDYGGLLVIILTAAIILIAVQPPKSIKNPLFWNLIISAILMASALLFVGRGLIHIYSYKSLIEQPSLRMGLIYVVFGSKLLLSKAIINYQSRHIN